MASLLSALGCSRAAEISAKALAKVAAEGRDAAGVMFDALEGNSDAALAEFSDAIEDAADEWDFLSAGERELARLLVRMELTKDQLEAILLSEAKRVRHRLPAKAEEITANPYLLCERFIPKRDHEPISFITVDHGLVPHDSMSALGEHRVAKRDPRRLRALLTAELEDQAGEGHTFFHANDSLAAAEVRSPDDRPCDVPLERLANEKVAVVIDETIERFELAEQEYVALRSIRGYEASIEGALDELVSRPPGDLPDIGWQEISDELARESEADPVELSGEQCTALDRSFTSHR